VLSGKRLFVLTAYFLLDFAVITIAYLLSYSLTAGHGRISMVLETSPGQGIINSGFDLVPSFAFSLVITAFLIYFLYSNGFYETRRGVRYSQEFLGIMRAVFFSVVFAASLNFLVLRLDASRAFTGLYSIFVFSGLFTWRYFKRKYVEHLVSAGYQRKRSLIVGAGRMGQYLKMILKGKDWLGVDVVGFLDDRYGIEEIESEDILGRIIDYENVVRHYKIDETYITIPSERKLVPMMLDLSSEMGVAVKVVPEMYDLIASEVKFENVGSLPIMNLSVPTLGSVQIFVKRAVELLFTIPALTLMLPIMAVIALVIKLEDNGPVFFKQKVLGLGGRQMCIYKFRSMRSDADDKVHKEYLEQLVKSNSPADTDNGVYKLANDDRITKVGEILRKYSLDELPQLWNVVRGDLSLVGPRPPVSYEYVHYDDYHRKRLLIKPGLTGLWQVSGKNQISFDKMIMLDILYINDWSIWLDVKIILDTIPVILRGKNF
jgi:exopolysaccharide biosynthesis polyprenyl glycosylphosphotransferase